MPTPSFRGNAEHQEYGDPPVTFLVALEQGLQATVRGRTDSPVTHDLGGAVTLIDGRP